MISIRNMKEADLKQILAIEAELFSEPWDWEIFQTCLQKHIAFVLEIKCRIGGYLTAIAYGNIYYITNIAICKDHQQQGFGKKLLKFFLGKYFIDENNIFYLDVRESNIAAIRLYEALGFTFFHRTKNYYHNPQEDALQMILTKNDRIYEKI